MKYCFQLLAGAVIFCTAYCTPVKEMDKTSEYIYDESSMFNTLTSLASSKDGIVKYIAELEIEDPKLPQVGILRSIDGVLDATKSLLENIRSKKLCEYNVQYIESNLPSMRLNPHVRDENLFHDMKSFPSYATASKIELVTNFMQLGYGFEDLFRKNAEKIAEMKEDHIEKIAQHLSKAKSDITQTAEKVNQIIGHLENELQEPNRVSNLIKTDTETIAKIVNSISDVDEDELKTKIESIKMCLKQAKETSSLKSKINELKSRIQELLMKLHVSLRSIPQTIEIFILAEPIHLYDHDKIHHFHNRLNRQIKAIAKFRRDVSARTPPTWISDLVVVLLGDIEFLEEANFELSLLNLKELDSYRGLFKGKQNFEPICSDLRFILKNVHSAVTDSMPLVADLSFDYRKNILEQYEDTIIRLKPEYCSKLYEYVGATMNGLSGIRTTLLKTLAAQRKPFDEMKGLFEKIEISFAKLKCIMKTVDANQLAAHIDGPIQELKGYVLDGFQKINDVHGWKTNAKKATDSINELLKEMNNMHCNLQTNLKSFFNDVETKFHLFKPLYPAKL